MSGFILLTGIEIEDKYS